MSVIFLFIDGVGLGKESDQNPMLNDTLKGFQFMSGNQPFTKKPDPILKTSHTFKAINATLGVDGLPQSGTGQTTLFTGVNAAKKIGKHFGPFPHSGIKPLLREKSLFNKAQAADKSCSFINGYPEIFFKKSRERNRWSCTTLMSKGADIPLNTTDDVKREKAITAGITQQAWREKLNIDVPVISPEKAAHRLLNQTKIYDLLLHEYYLTDKAGHTQQKEKADEYLERYDRFLWELIQSKPEEMTIILSSDHGNVEDLSTKTHTFNPVPLFVLGTGAPVFHQAENIMDITPGILKIL